MKHEKLKTGERLGVIPKKQLRKMRELLECIKKSEEAIDYWKKSYEKARDEYFRELAVLEKEFFLKGSRYIFNLDTGEVRFYEDPKQNCSSR